MSSMACIQPEMVRQPLNYPLLFWPFRKITAKRLQKRLKNTTSEEQDYDQQMAYLLSMKEKLEASVRKYESQSLEGNSDTLDFDN